MSFLELVTDKSEPPEPIIGNGILLRQTLLTIIGPPKVGKSFLAFNIASALASGNGFACFKIDKRHKFEVSVFTFFVTYSVKITVFSVEFFSKNLSSFSISVGFWKFFSIFGGELFSVFCRKKTYTRTFFFYRYDIPGLEIGRPSAGPPGRVIVGERSRSIGVKEL